MELPYIEGLTSPGCLLGERTLGELRAAVVLPPREQSDREEWRRASSLAFNPLPLSLGNHNSQALWNPSSSAD